MPEPHEPHERFYSCQAHATGESAGFNTKKTKGTKTTKKPCPRERSELPCDAVGRKWPAAGQPAERLRGLHALGGLGVKKD
jgi:hypothetical protein